MTIFFLSSGPILPLVGGRRLREYQMLKELTKLAPVRVLYLVRKSDRGHSKNEGHPSELAEFNGEVFKNKINFTPHELQDSSVSRFFDKFKPHFAKGFSEDLLKTLNLELKKGDIVWASRLRMAKYISKISQNIFTILDEHQIESDLLLDEAFQNLKRFREGFSAIQIARYERALTKKAELVITTSPIDAHRVQKLSPDSKVKIIPFQLNPKPYQESPHSTQPSVKKNQIVFVADLEYPPNIEAIEYVHKEILPRLKASLKNAELPEFIIASSDKISLKFPFPFKHYDSPEELGEILRESKVGLFPLLHGRGNRIHLLEAMASGLPLVCTGKAIDGLTLRPSHDLFIEDDADGITTLILRFLRDPKLCETTGKNARETIDTEYGKDSIKNNIEEIFSTLIPKT